MRSILLQVIVCAHLVLFSTEGGAALLSSYSAGSPEAVLGTRHTLDEILPARLRVVYGDVLVCTDPPDCEFWEPSRPGPVATVFDVDIAGTMSQTFVLDSGAAFDTVVALASNGRLEPMNHALEFADSAGSWSLSAKEDDFYGPHADLAGFNISQFELVVNAAFDSPGSDPNGDGRWAERNVYWTMNVYGEAVPIPATLWLFGSGLLALTGFARPRKGSCGAEAE